MIRAPVEILKHETEIMFVRDRIQHALGLRDDFGSHAVAGDYCDGKCFHWLKTILA